jgi:HEXXH motif-containing protein
LPDFTRFSPPQATHQSLNRDLAALADGFQLLATVWPAASAFAERWMRAIVVLAYEGCSRSHTSVHAPQTLMCSAESPVKVAEAICHEFSHARMYLYMERNAIIHNDWSKIHHSPWRRDPRPLIGLINGVHAFLNVCEFYGRLASFDAKWAQEADRVNAAQRTKIETAWHYARQKAEWTPAGERAAMDFDRAVQTLCS